MLVLFIILIYTLRELIFSGNTSRGLNATEGGQALAQEARVTGNKNLGVLIGTNGYVRGEAIRVHGNSSHGARLEVEADNMV